MGTAPILLQAQDVGGGYGRKQVVFDLSVDVRKGEIVAVLGHNGAGKTTTLKTLFGLLPLKDGRITYEGDDISNRLSTARNIKRGMALIPADNFVFGDLTVLDNLRLGGLHLDSNLNFDERFRYAC
jgi:branched-chain amino acid transport system ATP-binding protein